MGENRVLVGVNPLRGKNIETDGELPIDVLQQLGVVAFLLVYLVISLADACEQGASMFWEFTAPVGRIISVYLSVISGSLASRMEESQRVEEEEEAG